MSTPNFNQLAKDLYQPFSKVRRLHRVVSLVRPVALVMTLCWFAFCFYALTNYDSPVYQWLMQRWWIIVAVFVVLSAFLYLFAYSHQSLLRKEAILIQKTLGQLFPGARYTPFMAASPTRNTGRETVAARRWGVPLPNAVCYGLVQIPCQGTTIQVADIGIIKDRTAFALSNPLTGYFTLLWKAIGKPLTGARTESQMTDFRGMLVTLDSTIKLKGELHLVPDHLERQVGYLARSIQELKNNASLHLIYMEDITFEHHFAVYANDDIYARRILTPAMMRRITQLRLHRGKDISFKFVDGMFSFTVERPDGLFTVPRPTDDGETFLRSFYSDICSFREITDALKIELQSHTSSNNPTSFHSL